jgi:hypothetical protein
MALLLGASSPSSLATIVMPPPLEHTTSMD